MVLINMYQKITLCFLIFLTIVRSEEVSTTKNMKNSDLLHSQLSTNVPYPSLRTNEHFTKNSSEESLVSLMSLSQTQNEPVKLKDTIQKRCDMHHKNSFLLTKENNNRAESNEDIEIGISKKNSANHIIKNANLQEKSAVSKTPETQKEILLQALKNDLNSEDVIVNLTSRQKRRKCNTGKYICHCKEDCSSHSSKSSSEILKSSKINKNRRMNCRKLMKHENVKSDIAQQKLPILYHKSPHEILFPNLFNHFPIQPQERINIPPIPIVYEIVPNVSPHLIENAGKYMNVESSFTSLEDRSDYLIGNNQYQSIHQKPCVCAPVAEIHSDKNSISTLDDYIDATNNFQSEEDQEYFHESGATKIDLSTDSETKINFLKNYLTGVTEKSSTMNSNVNKDILKSEDFTKQTEKDSELSKLTTPSINYKADDIPFFMLDETNDKHINMEECIQLFGRDICVLSATSSKMLIKQKQENKPNNYSTIKIPEYVTQMSAKKEMTSNNIEYSDILKTTETYFVPKSSNGINESTNAKSNADINETSSHEFPGSAEQIYKPDINYETTISFNTANAIPTKKLTDPIIDETTRKEEDKLGKSKSHTLLLNPNNEEMANPTLNEKFLHSTPSYNPTNNKETKEEIVENGTRVYSGDISQESTTVQYLDDEKLNELNHKENITNTFEASSIDSSTRKLLFYDNILLVNSIRKVINDFALDPYLTETKNFNKNTVQEQGRNLLPEILQIPNMKSILSMPKIENTIIEKVKKVLSHITAIPRENFTNNWSHSVIRNTLHSILDTDFHHKFQSTFEEHQFKDEQWKTNFVTLAPILDQKLFKGIPEILRESIKDLLISPIITSQTDQHIIRNMIVQSVKNDLANNKNNNIDDMMIQILNNMLNILNTKNITVLGTNYEIINNEKNAKNMTILLKTIMKNNKTEIKVSNSTLHDKHFEIKVDNADNKTQITNYQKAETLENNTILLTTEFPYLLQLSKEEEEMTPKPIAKMKENVTDLQNNGEKNLVEPKIIYHKAILHNNSQISMNLKSNLTETEQYIKDCIDQEDITETTTATNFIEKTSPNYIPVLDDENVAVTKNTEEIKRISNEEKVTTSTELNPLIILERIKFNMPPTKYYSPEILKNTQNHRIDDEEIETTIAPTSLKQEILSSYERQSDNALLQNIKTKNDRENEYSSSKNLISSTNTEYNNNKSKDISFINGSTLEPQNLQQNFTEDNIVKIHEVTTDVQQTYAKTTYFKTESDNGSKINSSSLTFKATDIRTSNNDKENTNSNDTNNRNNNIIDEKISDIGNAMKTEKIIVSSSKSSAKDNLLQTLPSFTLDDISELQKSQLYYISDGMKLPLEIKRLEDGSYALSISKNVCEQILTRKCPCCVPLQGYIIQSLKNYQENKHKISSIEKKDQENIYTNNVKKDYQVSQSSKAMETKENVLKIQESKDKEAEKEEGKIHCLWKQDNEDIVTISMPVIDFAKKYNLLLDFNEKEMINKMQNIDKSLIKSEQVPNYDQLEEKKNTLLDKNSEIIDKIHNSINIRERKNIQDMNFPIIKKLFNLRKNFDQFGVQKTNTELNYPKYDINFKDVEKLNTSEVNLSEGSKMNKEKIKWGKLSDIAKEVINIFHKKKNREHEATELIDSNTELHNVPRIRIFKENIGKPYRHQ